MRKIESFLTTTDTIERYTKQYNCLKEFKHMKESGMFNPGWDFDHSIITTDPNEIKQDLIVRREQNGANIQFPLIRVEYKYVAEHLWEVNIFADFDGIKDVFKIPEAANTFIDGLKGE